MINYDFNKLLNNNAISLFLYDTLTSVVEFSENEPIYIPLFAKALHDFKHEGLYDKKKPVNYDKFLEEFRVLYCSCFIHEKRIESIKILSNLKPVGVFNYIFESPDWSPTIDLFRFYQLSFRNNICSPHWREIRDDIHFFTKSNYLIDDDVKRQIRFMELWYSEDNDKIIFKNEINKKSLILMKSTSKKIDLDQDFFANFTSYPILLIGFEEEEFSHLKFEFKKISEGIFIHFTQNIISEISKD
ncbi:MAG: hypothetical protein JZU47_05735 [Prolixibacteraceae bacterium]|nr:hypothetical protein [Prolixibacteraceae bacterium]